MRALRTTSLIILLAGLSGCREESLVANELDQLASSASRVVLYSLDPAQRHDNAPHTNTIFHGFGILGRAEITDQQERQALLRALAEGVRNNDGVVAACFRPRHALHIEHAGRRIDLTICFECFSVQTHGFNQGKGFMTSERPESTFDEALKRHRLPKSTNEA
jgi:hypothetical protein